MKIDIDDILLDLVNDDIGIDEAKEKLLILYNVSNCPACNSDDLHQFKLQHIHCKSCKEDFERGCY
jgi:ribosomal protein L37AE/L43A